MDVIAAPGQLRRWAYASIREYSRPRVLREQLNHKSFVKMIGLRIEINRCVEEGQPNVVECSFLDGYGKRHFFLEKVPVVSGDDLNSTSLYPRVGVIACQVIKRKNEGDFEIIEIDTGTLWGIQSLEGQSCFEVLPAQLVEE